MKKSLIALAALSAFASAAQAQSSVSIYGILSSGYATQTTDVDGSSVKNTNSNLEGAQSGSRLGFRGTEDLGGGLKAGFVYELGASVDSGLAANRLGYAELSGNMGTLRFGKQDGVVRQVTNSFTSHGNSGFAAGNVAASMSALSTTVGSLLAGIATPTGTRVSYAAATVALDPATATAPTDAELATYNTALNAQMDKVQYSANNARYNYDAEDIAVLERKRDLGQQAAVLSALQFGQAANRYVAMSYITPAFNGLTAQLQYGKLKNDVSDTAGNADRDVFSGGLAYTNGPLALSYGREVIKAGVEATLKTGLDTNTADARTKATVDTFGAAYDMKVAKGFLQHTRKTVEGVSYTFARVLDYSSHTGAADSTIAVTTDGLESIVAAADTSANTYKIRNTDVGVAIPVGNFTFVGSYSDGKVTGSAETDIKAYQLQANYNFSKNTKGYLMTGETKLNDFDVKVKGTVLGVQHSF